MNASTTFINDLPQVIKIIVRYSKQYRILLMEQEILWHYLIKIGIHIKQIGKILMGYLVK